MSRRSHTALEKPAPTTITWRERLRQKELVLGWVPSTTQVVHVRHGRSGPRGEVRLEGPNLQHCLIWSDKSRTAAANDLVDREVGVGVCIENVVSRIEMLHGSHRPKLAGRQRCASQTISGGLLLFHDLVFDRSYRAWFYVVSSDSPMGADISRVRNVTSR